MTVKEIVQQGAKETVDLLKQYDDINNQFMEEEIINDSEKMDALIKLQGKVQEQIDQLDAWDLDSKLELAMDALRTPSFPFRIHGYITPLAPQKSLRFYINQKNKVNTLLEVNHEIDKIILRSSFSGWGNEIFVDGWISKVCENLNVDVMSYKPVLVYLNGEYWGIHGLRERMDLKAISNKYKIKVKKSNKC